MAPTPGSSGRLGASSREDAELPADATSARRQQGAEAGASDRWSADDGHPSGQPVYDMSFPEKDKNGVKWGSPLASEATLPNMERSQKDPREGGGAPGQQEFGARSSAPQDVRQHVQAVIEQNKELVQPKVVRNLLVTYAITVLIVTLLSIGGTVAVDIYIRNSKSDAVVVNLSGRQRMLSQLLVKDAAAMHYATANPNRTNLKDQDPDRYYLAEITEKLPLWIASRDALINGSDGSTPDVPAIPGTSDQRIVQLSQEQQRYFNSMVGALKAIQATPDVDDLLLRVVGPLTDNVDALLANEPGFWQLQDQITLVFQQNADSHLQVLLILAWVLMALVILTLLLEGLCIIWPVTRSLQRLISERFTLIRKSLETEAENRGVSMLMMGYISHEILQPLASLAEHLDSCRDFLHSVENALPLQETQQPSAPQSGAAHQHPEAAHAGAAHPEAAPAGAAAGAFGSPTRGPKDPLQGAVAEVDKARVASELLQLVSRDISNLRNIELGRMTLVVEVVDVADVIQQVLSILAPKIPRRVQLRVDVDPRVEEQKHRLDKHRLQQILLNLVDNAFRTTPEGRVTVRARPSRSQGCIRVEVQDTGEGLTEEQRRSLYEPVLDSSGLRAGDTNLALYVVKLLVELQEGRHGMEPAPGGGNLHWVELPSSSAAMEAAQGPGGMESVREGDGALLEGEDVV